jgi:type I restriction enzyme S subunit
MEVREASAGYAGLTELPGEAVPFGYKQTEVGLIPTQWDVKLLGDLFSFRNGVNADGGAYGRGVRFINVLEPITYSHIYGPEISGKVTLAEAVVSSYAVRRGDIVFNRTSETQEDIGLAASYLGSDRVVFGGFVICGRPVDTTFDPGYLGYALRARCIRSQIIPMGQGAIRANISQSNLKGVSVPVPPSVEQRAIAGALSDADALIESLEQLIAKKRQIKQGSMQALLTGKQRLPGFGDEWKEITLGDLGSTYGGLTGKTKADFGDGAGRYVTFMNVMSNVVIDSQAFERVKISPSESQNRVMRGDLLFNGSSETPEEVALCAVVTEDTPNLFLNSFCFGFRFRDGAAADGLFMAYFLRGLAGRELMKSLAQGSTRYNLSKAALLRAPLCLPGISEQAAIATILTDMDTELAELETRLAKTRQLKQGMMQELLTGRIRLV